jgi:hypothetical protein
MFDAPGELRPGAEFLFRILISENYSKNSGDHGHMRIAHEFDDKFKLYTNGPPPRLGDYNVVTYRTNTGTTGD